MSRFWKVLIRAVAILSVLALLVSCGTVVPFPDSLEELPDPWEELPDEPENGVNESQSVSNHVLSENSLIGIAAFNEFDAVRTVKLSKASFNLNSKRGVTAGLDEQGGFGEEEYLKISYPYDYVKIKSAYKFTINVSELEDPVAEKIIEEGCGLGEIEVVVADFETYIDNNGYKQLSVQDTMICLRGYNGYYTILANSGALTGDSYLHVFSSHKKLTADEVNKDFTPPILSVFLKEEQGSRYDYFETSDNLLSFGSYDEESAFKNTSEIESVSRNTVYSVLELAKLPVKEVSATVLEIDSENKTIKVMAGCNLEYVHIGENTEGVKAEDLSVGDVITVEYDFLFEKYDPVYVIANSVNISTGTDETDDLGE